MKHGVVESRAEDESHKAEVSLTVFTGAQEKADETKDVVVAATNSKDPFEDGDRMKHDVVESCAEEGTS